ncbi:MAG: acetyl-CoA carboxylase biotin carboxylase subunit [Nitrospirae bacterium]|nr:acetyl-CoA carboxylase biotin carboxylase subunit [Nitrospirota bacterium]MBF0541656.1 acetyl-CoA carboxylase biotin carboxylase subunit [Nitrospirota bacterium]
MFKKILIANRGEIAVRIIRACKELGIGTVAVYSDKEKDSLHLRLADESVCIGPANIAASYLNIPAILTAAELTDAEAIHPGYGFLAENPQFADACAKSNITFIGPTTENILTGGNKIKAKQILRKKGVPVIPGSDGTIDDEKIAYKIAKKVGLPVIIKASAGGGGKGMRVVNEPEELANAIALAHHEAITYFGDGSLYIEKYLTRVRHIEVQIAADKSGNIIHLGERDCSIQRRHQKLIEESPSPIFTEKLRKKIGEYAIKAAKALNYRNVGTIEFILDRADNIYFMEINTRVQVEHPVTEMVTGIDIIKEQIRLAAGYNLSVRQSNININGHSIECRINAEDPVTFVPCPGKIESLRLPGGFGVRIDTAIYQGYTISPHYDSLIAKVIVHGNNRLEAIARMIRALDEFHVEGIKTTIPFHKKVLTNPSFISGKFNTSFIEELNAQEAINGATNSPLS